MRRGASTATRNATDLVDPVRVQHTKVAAALSNALLRLGARIDAPRRHTTFAPDSAQHTVDVAEAADSGRVRSSATAYERSLRARAGRVFRDSLRADRAFVPASLLRRRGGAAEDGAADGAADSGDEGEDGSGDEGGGGGGYGGGYSDEDGWV